MKVRGSLKVYVGIAVAVGILAMTYQLTMQSPVEKVLEVSSPLRVQVPPFSSPPSSTQPSPVAANDLKPTARWFDPATVRIGDRVSTWTVIDKQKETFGKGSVVYTMEGTAKLTGTYSVNYEEETYNSNQIVFIADEDSSLKLPQPLAFKGSPNRMILHIPKSEDERKLGIPGSTGRATIVIGTYSSVYADILEGVSDAAEVSAFQHTETTPPPATEVAQVDLDQALHNGLLTSLHMESSQLTDAASLPLMQDWLNQLNQQFLQTLSPYSSKRISPAQKDQIQTWLLQAFTEIKAKEIIATHVPPSGIHHLLSNSFLDILPYGQVKEIKNQELKLEDSATLSYKALYILSGTHDTQITYEFKREQREWKLHHYEIKLI